MIFFCRRSLARRKGNASESPVKSQNSRNTHWPIGKLLSSAASGSPINLDKRQMKIAIAQINTTIGDFDGNADKTEKQEGEKRNKTKTNTNTNAKQTQSSKNTQGNIGPFAKPVSRGMRAPFPGKRRRKDEICQGKWPKAAGNSSQIELESR